MERITVSLATIHGQVVRMTADELVVANDELAAQVHRLRDDARTAADALQGAYREIEPNENDGGPTQAHPPQAKDDNQYLE
jgi:hypothetical protein